MNRHLSQRFTGYGIAGLAMLAVLVAPAWGAEPEYTADIDTNAPFETPESSHDCNDVLNPITNCGFESGDFTGWGSEDMNIFFFPLGVGPAGTNVGFSFFTSAPTEGLSSVQHGFDGDGGTGPVDTIRVWQDLSLPPGSGDLIFDYRAAWDMTFGATLDRTFRVDIEPFGGGAALQTDTLLTAVAGQTVTDTGLQEGVIDVSSFAGSDVRISFEWDIPEDVTGPGFFELDNVLVEVNPVASATIDIPTLSGTGILAMILLLAAASSLVLANRRRA